MKKKSASTLNEKIQEAKSHIEKFREIIGSSDISDESLNSEGGKNEMPTREYEFVKTPDNYSKRKRSRYYDIEKQTRDETEIENETFIKRHHHKKPHRSHHHKHTHEQEFTFDLDEYGSPKYISKSRRHSSRINIDDSDFHVQHHHRHHHREKPSFDLSKFILSSSSSTNTDELTSQYITKGKKKCTGYSRRIPRYLDSDSSSSDDAFIAMMMAKYARDYKPEEGTPEISPVKPAIEKKPVQKEEKAPPVEFSTASIQAGPEEESSSSSFNVDQYLASQGIAQYSRPISSDSEESVPKASDAARSFPKPEVNHFVPKEQAPKPIIPKPTPPPRFLEENAMRPIRPTNPAFMAAAAQPQKEKTPGFKLFMVPTPPVGLKRFTPNDLSPFSGNNGQEENNIFNSLSFNEEEEVRVSPTHRLSYAKSNDQFGPEFQLKQNETLISSDYNSTEIEEEEFHGLEVLGEDHQPNQNEMIKSPMEKIKDDEEESSSLLEIGEIIPDDEILKEEAAIKPEEQETDTEALLADTDQILTFQISDDEQLKKPIKPAMENEPKLDDEEPIASSGIGIKTSSDNVFDLDDIPDLGSASSFDD